MMLLLQHPQSRQHRPRRLRSPLRCSDDGAMPVQLHLRLAAVAAVAVADAGSARGPGPPTQSSRRTSLGPRGAMVALLAALRSGHDIARGATVSAIAAMAASPSLLDEGEHVIVATSRRRR